MRYKQTEVLHRIVDTPSGIPGKLAENIHRGITRSVRDSFRGRRNYLREWNRFFIVKFKDDMY